MGESKKPPQCEMARKSFKATSLKGMQQIGGIRGGFL